MKLISEFAGLDMNQKHKMTNDYHQSSDSLVENYVTDYSIPEGVGVNFMINGTEKTCSNGNRRTIRDCGG